jgi:hypothetical protein
MQPYQTIWTRVVTHLLYRPSTMRWLASLEPSSHLHLPSLTPEDSTWKTKLGRWNFQVTPSQLERRIDLAITDNCIGSYSGRS